MKRSDLILTIWKGSAIAFAGVIAFFTNLLTKFPDFSRFGEEIAFYASYASGSVPIVLAISFVALTIRLWRLSE